MASATVCEHVTFHLCLRRHGVRIAIQPSLVGVSGSRLEQRCGRSVQDGHPRVRGFAYKWLRNGTMQSTINGINGDRVAAIEWLHADSASAAQFAHISASDEHFPIS